MPLASIQVRDFAIVRNLDILFSEGLTVLTGETGAGKSVMIDALDLVLGARGDSNMIRHGADSTEVHAVFDIETNEDANQWLKSHEFQNGGQCVLRRTLYREKPTKSFINGHPVTVQMLKNLGEYLVDIHGQHEHQSLLRRETQRRIVDDFAGQDEAVTQLAQLYDNYQLLQHRLNSLTQQSQDREAQIDLYRFQVDEIDQLDPKENEFLELEQEHDRLAHANELIDGMKFAADALYDAEDGAVISLLSRATQKMETLSEFEPRLNEIVTLLANASVEVEEATSSLHQLLDRTELDPQRLNWAQQRIGTMIDLARKHQCQPDELLEISNRLQQQLADLENAEVNIEQLQNKLEQTRREYDVLAKKISEKRAETSIQLAMDISERMQTLGMQGGAFTIYVDAEPNEPTRYGYDRIEFLVAANPGQPARPLSKVASGGELSRISLAIQVASSQVGRIPTLVFDEVDVGVGGKVAEIVGQQLRKLAKSRQVLCITHLPQVAAQGRHHLHALKDNRQAVQVNIQELQSSARINEIARMLGGIEITQQTLDHAEEMLNRASAST